MLQPLTRTLETANLHSTDKASSLIIGQPGTGCLLETYSRTSIVHAYVRFVSSISAPTQSRLIQPNIATHPLPRCINIEQKTR